jgi:hypothetical protein
MICKTTCKSQKLLVMRQLFSDFSEYNQHLGMCPNLPYCSSSYCSNFPERHCTIVQVSPVLYVTSNTRIYLLYGCIVASPSGEYLFVREG